MPSMRASAAATRLGETNKSVEFEDCVNTDGENDNEETVEEEIEYEEEEVEVEKEGEEEEGEEEEDEVEEAAEEHDANGAGAQNVLNDEDMKDAETEEEVKKKHAELLALPPHGSVVDLGGFTQDVLEDDFRSFCESIGEVTKIRIMKGKGSNEKKGYAFVTFGTKEMATEAIKSLNNTELKGKKLKCSTSQEKSSAMKALKNTEKYEMNGQVLECSLSKPQADQKSSGQPNSQKAAVLPTYPPPVGYGMVGVNYGAYCGGFTQKC